MQILITAATNLEIKGFLDKIEKKESFYENLWNFSNGNKNFALLITGIGSSISTYNLLKTLQTKKYDLVINCGLAGSFTKDIPIGSLVNVVSDCFADLGSDDNGNFLSVYDLKLENPNTFPFSNGKLVNKTSLKFINLPKVCGITVNKASGNEKEIDFLKQKYNPITESMEGAGIAYTCIMEKIPFVQIRAISNYVLPRNQQNWNIKLALNNLHNFLFSLMKNYSDEK
ncbi:MAG: futalosine hydrolase [Bacteroidales bacterium]|nr:futalosine hydrolase [Bacteroidales bacterium]